MTWVVIGIVVAAIAGVLLVVAARRRVPDGVTTFQRQIDALSPDARRSVVRSVQESDAKAQPQRESDPSRRAPGDDAGVVGDPLRRARPSDHDPADDPAGEES